jgi:hypothetical protein
LHGKYREFEDGNLVKIGRYYFGNKIGIEKEFYSTGRLRSIVNYQYGKMVSKKKFHGNGKLNSQVFYDHDELAILSKIYNQTGLLVEEIKDNESGQLTRVYDFEAKNYKNYQTDEDGHFIGSYYSTFDEDGALIHAVDFSKLDSKKIILIYPDLKIELVFNADKKASILIKPENSASTYVVNDELNVFKHYVGNQLKGIYNMKTGEVNGVINFIKINKFFEERTSFDRYGIFDDIDDWMKVSSTPQLYLFQVDKESRDLRDFCEFIID